MLSLARRKNGKIRGPRCPGCGEPLAALRAAFGPDLQGHIERKRWLGEMHHSVKKPGLALFIPPRREQRHNR